MVLTLLNKTMKVIQVKTVGRIEADKGLSKDFFHEDPIVSKLILPHTSSFKISKQTKYHERTR